MNKDMQSGYCSFEGELSIVGPNVLKCCEFLNSMYNENRT